MEIIEDFEYYALVSLSTMDGDLQFTSMELAREYVKNKYPREVFTWSNAFNGEYGSNTTSDNVTKAFVIIKHKGILINGVLYKRLPLIGELPTKETLPF